MPRGAAGTGHAHLEGDRSAPGTFPGWRQQGTDTSQKKKNKSTEVLSDTPRGRWRSDRDTLKATEVPEGPPQGGGDGARTPPERRRCRVKPPMGQRGHL